jgi:hypothetical protein
MNNEPKPIDKTDKPARRAHLIPAKQLDMLNLAEAVLEKWTNTPFITLQWVTVEEYKKLVMQFKTSLEQRLQVGSGRQTKTMLLRALDADLHKAVEELKICILGKFGRERGRSYFSEFGIIKTNRVFRLPIDRNQKVQALDMLVKGLEKYAIEPVDYPVVFFKKTRDEYDKLMQEAYTIDSAVASEVGVKNEAIKHIEKVLASLVFVIRGNYPDTYKSELRGWGFQKEKH